MCSRWKGVERRHLPLLEYPIFAVLNSGEEVEIIQESTIEETLEKGTKISLGINTVKTNVFTADGKQNILTGVLTDHLAQSEEA